MVAVWQRVPEPVRIRLTGGVPTDDPLGRVRWYFLVFSVGMAATLIFPLALVAASGHLVAAAVACVLPCLAAKWVREYRGHQDGVAWDILEANSFLSIALATGNPLTILVLLFGRIAYRALDDSTLRLVTLTVLFSTAFLGAIAVWTATGGSPAAFLGYAFVTPGFVLVASVMHGLGQTMRRLARSTERERALRRAIAALHPALPDDEVAQAAADAVRGLIGHVDVDAVIALGPLDDLHVAATSRSVSDHSALGRFVDLSQLTPTQLESLHEGTLQLTGIELAMVWPAERYARPEALFMAALRTEEGTLGVLFVSGAGVPEDDRVTVVILVEHIALRLQAMTMSRDIDERVVMEAALRESEANFRRLFEASPQPMWLYDAATFQFLAVNEAAVAHYGYSSEEFLDMCVEDIAAPNPGRRSLHADNDRRRRPTVTASRHRAKDGRIMDVEVDNNNLTFQSRESVLTLARDVTEERELQRRLEHQTLHDTMTGLPNRHLLESRTAQALGRTARLPGRLPAMLVLDLDGFKTINDTLGHAAGDRVITAVADRLAGSLRPGDTAARLGGDEFAVLLEDTAGAEDALQVAERLVAEIQKPIPMDGRNLAVNASVGIALPRPGHSSSDELVTDADIAMYVAKGRGTGICVLFDPAYRAALLDRHTLQEELTVAMANDELLVHYQPQLELASGRVVAVEALVRWAHPTRGLIAPDAFIPVAEQMGLIPAIDAWVLHTACRQLRTWFDAGLPPMRVAVNLSGNDLERSDLVDMVRGALHECMLDPWQVELELTESVAVGQPEGVVARLAELRSLGVRIAIDDFGTGYSMFSRLRDLPVDRLKIDRSFVNDVTRDDDARAIVASTIAMGHALGLDIVAEGVEDEATALMLTELRCDTAQGYHLARPMAVDAASEWLVEHAASHPVVHVVAS